MRPTLRRKTREERSRSHPHSVSRRSGRKLATNRPEPFSMGCKKREQGGGVEMKLRARKHREPGLSSPMYEREAMDHFQGGSFGELEKGRSH